MVTGVSSMPTDEGYDHDENSGSGNDDHVESQMTDCQCNDINLTMLNEKFLLMWLNFAEHQIITCSTQIKSFYRLVGGK